MDNIKIGATTKLVVLYALTLGLIYLGFWIGYYYLTNWWGIGTALIIVAISSILLAVYKKKLWSAFLSCICVSVGIGQSISTFFVVLDVVPSKFFGLVLIFVIVYKIGQSFLLNHFRRKTTASISIIILEIALAIVFFSKMSENMGLYSQIGFAFVVAIFLSFGQLSLYKCGANTLWRTIALSYIIGFAFIVLFIVLLIISVLTEDGSPLELLEGLSFGGSTNPKKNKRKSI